MPSAIQTNAEENVPVLQRDFSTLTNFEEIRECLRLLDEEETRIDASLDDMLAQEKSLDYALSTLDTLR
jgi:hypothetical protein